MSDNPPIEYAFPELRRWEAGGPAPYTHVRDSGKAGPTVMVAALTHGNEVSGAVVVDALLASELKPRSGTLIFSFNNIEAYLGFDPKNPFNPINSVDPGNPGNPINRFNPNNPFNPINEFNPDNPMNPINRHNPDTPFKPLQ